MPNFDDAEYYSPDELQFKPIKYRQTGFANYKISGGMYVVPQSAGPTARVLTAGYRLVIGEQSAELLQRRRLAFKYSQSSTGRVALAYRRALLRAHSANENVQTVEGRDSATLKVWQRIAKLLYAPSKRLSAATQGRFEPYHKAGQFLALLDAAETAATSALLERGHLEADELFDIVGNQRALRFINRLGWAELATMAGTKLVATDSARELHQALIRTAGSEGDSQL